MKIENIIFDLHTFFLFLPNGDFYVSLIETVLWK